MWIYLRDSGGESQDLDSQRAYVKAYCEYHKLRIAEIFEDAAKSGGSTENRIQFNAMIAKAENSHRKPDGIIFWDTKRLARNQNDSQFFKSSLRRLGIKLVFISDDIPDDEDYAILFEAFQEWKAQKDRMDISKDSRRGLAYNVGSKDQNGNYIGIVPGKPPKCFKGERYDTGRRRNNGKPRIVQKWVPDPETWKRGQTAFEMRANGASYRDIERAVALFPNATNPSSSYHTFFKNRIYIGEFIYGGEKYTNFVPALTTIEIWQKVQDRFYKRPKRGKKWQSGKQHPKIGHTPYLLSGMCVCDYCGRKLHGQRNVRSNGRTWPFYVCSGKKNRQCTNSSQISAKKLESAILETVLTQLFTVDYIAQLTDAVNEQLSDVGQLEMKIANAHKRLSKTTKSINNLLKAIEDGTQISSVLERLSLRENELETVKYEIHELEHMQSAANLVRISETELSALLTDMGNSLKSNMRKAQRQILQEAVEKVEVGRGYARLHLTFPLTRVYLVPPTGFEPVSQP